MTKRAGVYCRISKDRVGAGLGVERQEQDCRELAGRLGWSVVEVYRDNDLSAYSGKPRPGYLALLGDIRSGAVDAVLAWHSDRLHRSPVELEEYIAACDPRGVPTHCVKAGPLDLSTPSGRLVARQLGAVARYEVEHSIERQQRAKLQAATSGKWKGGRRPFGYEDDGITVRPSEAAEVLRASEAVLNGSSLRSIAADLNARGLVTSTGAAWRQDTVRKVLLRPRNAGLMEHRDEVIGAAGWPAIVPETIWRGVVATLTNPERRTQFSSIRRWMGSGLYRCYCGAVVRATTGGVRDSQPKVAYMCSAGKHVVRTAEEVDAWISAVVVARLSKPDAVDLLAETATVDTAALRTEETAIAAQLDELATMYARRKLTARQLETGTESLRRQLEDVQRQIADASRGSVLAGIAGAPDVRKVWKSYDLDRKRAIIDYLMTVTLLRSHRGRRRGWKPGESYFDSDTVQIEPKR